MSRGRALVYGSLNPDLVHTVERLPGPGDDLRSSGWRLTFGGKAANAAAALAGWGVDTSLTGLVLGADPLGDALLAALVRPHLDLSHVAQDSGQATRHCVVLVTPDGDRAIVSTGYEGARWQEVPPAAWEGVGVTLVDGLCLPAGTGVVEEARARRVPVVWLDAPPDLAHLADLVVWSRHEHSPAEAAAAGRRTDVVLTAGPEPLVAWLSGERLRIVPPAAGPVVDGTGAGDVFAAACARGLLLGWERPATLRWAAAAGAALARRSRSAGMPSLDDVAGLTRSF